MTVGSFKFKTDRLWSYSRYPMIVIQVWTFVIVAEVAWYWIVTGVVLAIPILWLLSEIDTKKIWPQESKEVYRHMK